MYLLLCSSVFMVRFAFPMRGAVSSHLCTSHLRISAFAYFRISAPPYLCISVPFLHLGSVTTISIRPLLRSLYGAVHCGQAFPSRERCGCLQVRLPTCLWIVQSFMLQLVLVSPPPTGSNPTMKHKLNIWAPNSTSYPSKTPTGRDNLPRLIRRLPLTACILLLP